MRHVNCPVLSAAATANATGAKIDSNQLVSASFHFVFGDAAGAGTVKIQASNDINNDYYQGNAFTPTNWVDIPAATATIVAGAPALISLSNMSYRWMRVVFTRTGGTTTIVCNMNAMGV